MTSMIQDDMGVLWLDLDTTESVMVYKFEEYAYVCIGTKSRSHTLQYADPAHAMRQGILLKEYI